MSKKTEARISFNNNKLPSANLVPLTPCFILVCYRDYIQLQMCGKGRWEHARCQKSPDLQYCNQCNSGAKSQKLGNLANMWFPPAAHKYPRHHCPFYASTSKTTTTRSCINLCILEYYMSMYPCYAHADVSLLHSHPALWMFLTPGPSFCMKYIHVSRAWPSLGQVHSEFGSELEQPLATRLHWTKGRNITQSDKLSKKKNTKNLKIKSFISQTLASLPGTQMIVQSFSSGRNQPMPEDHYCHFWYHSWSLLHVGL